jgi:hypothetical protein
MADPVIDDQGQVSVSAPNTSFTTFRAADQACQSLHQAAERANGRGTATEKADPAKLLAFSRCMRAHGLHDFPDPSGQGELSISSSQGSDLSPRNPAFQRAQQACQSILGTPRGGEKVQIGGSGTGSGDSGASATTGGKS